MTASVSTDSAEWQPFREPARTTIVRTFAIALVAGGVVAWGWGGLARWPVATLVMLWPSLGGHFIELWFLNWLRPRLPRSRAVQTLARLAVWFIAGVGLLLAMRLTTVALTGVRYVQWPALWLGGVAFIAIELVAHLALRARRRPSFYDGRG